MENSYSPNHPDPAASSYTSHVDFVSSENGTTVKEIIEILLSISMTPLLVSLILPWAVPPKFIYHAAKDSCFFTYIRAIIEYPFIVVLPVWLVTVFAGQDGDEKEEATKWSTLMLIILLSTCLGIMVVNYGITEPKWEGFWSFWDKIKDKPLTSSVPFVGLLHDPINNKPAAAAKGKSNSNGGGGDKIKYPFITNYRAIVIYVTVIAILAVDFPIFPRRYAKTKKYGYSLMDLGTGAFIFANGIIAPEAKGRKSNLLKSWISTLPLFVLGIFRLISVKGIEYHEVVEEYGVHWNFFFTLASVKLLSASIFSCIDPAVSLKLSCLIGLLYEYFLSKDNLLENYLLNENTQRNNIIDANREGLYSVWGYLTIYFASIYIGKVIYCINSQSIKEWSHYTCRSMIHVSLLWIAHYISTTYGTRSCRRAANLSYSLWILATNYTILWSLGMISLLQAIAQNCGLLHGPLIAYELQAMMGREQEKIKTLHQQFTNNKAKGLIGSGGEEKRKRDKEMEKALSQLEDKLEEFQKSGKSSICSEVTEIIKHLEKELCHIGEQLKKEEEGENDGGEEEVEEKKKEKNLISMPDLSKSPVTLEAICYNGLLVFLLGNLLTGFVNCVMQTIYVPDYMALCYLWAYATIVSTISIVLYIYDIQVKYW